MPLGDRLGESETIQLLTPDVDHVAARTSVLDALGSEDAPKVGDVGVKRMGRSLRGLGSPEVVHETVDQHHPVAGGEQERQEGSLARAPEVQSGVATYDLERT